MVNNLDNREEWLRKALKRIPKGRKILDAGAGELQYKKFCSHLKYTSQDFAQYTGNNLKEGLQIGSWDNTKLDIISDIAKIPVKDKSFDSIMCIEVLEHLPQPALAIKEFSRIIKKNGVLIITAPFCSLTHFAPYYYGNGYSKYWYEAILTQHGFKIEEISYNGNYFDYIVQEINRLDYVVNTYSRITKKESYLLKIAKYLLIPLLNKFSSHDRKSHELLCFGLHVRAKKS